MKLAMWLTPVAATLPPALPADNASQPVITTELAKESRYVIMDNDWDSTSFISVLLALQSGFNLLGVASDTADTWVGQTSLHAVGHKRVPNPPLMLSQSLPCDP